MNNDSTSSGARAADEFKRIVLHIHGSRGFSVKKIEYLTSIPKGILYRIISVWRLQDDGSPGTVKALDFADTQVSCSSIIITSNYFTDL